MNVFSASPVQSCDLTSGRLRMPPPPRDPEGRRREMTDADLARTIIAANVTFFLILAVWWFMNRRK